MSTTTLSRPAAERSPVGLGRLVQVELRKAVDTRAGLWLMLAVAAITIGAAVLTALVGDDPTVGDVLDNGMQPAGILLPVVGILSVTSEWSQRTALSTFSLVPARGRVIVAKVLAMSLLALAAWALAVVASLGLGAVLGASGGLQDAPAILLQTIVFQVTGMLTGVAFGAAFGSSPVAIVLYFVLPTVLSAVTNLVSALEGAGRWLDTSQTLAPLTDHALTGAEWARVVTSLALWLVLPLAVGTWRILTREVK